MKRPEAMADRELVEFTNRMADQFHNRPNGDTRRALYKLWARYSAEVFRRSQRYGGNPSQWNRLRAERVGAREEP